jgi:hypothetical protein
MGPALVFASIRFCRGARAGLGVADEAAFAGQTVACCSPGPYFSPVKPVELVELVEPVEPVEPVENDRGLVLVR